MASAVLSAAAVVAAAAAEAAAAALIETSCRAVPGRAGRWTFERFRGPIRDNRVVEMAELMKKDPALREADVDDERVQQKKLHQEAAATEAAVLSQGDDYLLGFCHLDLFYRIDGCAMWTAHTGLTMLMDALVDPQIARAARVQLAVVLLPFLVRCDLRPNYKEDYERLLRDARVTGLVPDKQGPARMAGPFVEWLGNTADGARAVSGFRFLHSFFLARRGILDMWAQGRGVEACARAALATDIWLAVMTKLGPRTIAPFAVTEPLALHETAVLSVRAIQDLLAARGPLPEGAVFAKSTRHGQHLALRARRDGDVASQAAVSDAVGALADADRERLLPVVFDALPGSEDEILLLQALQQVGEGADYVGNRREFHSEREIDSTDTGPHVDFAVLAIHAVLACLPPVRGGFRVGGLGQTARAVLARAVAAAPPDALRLADDSGLHVPHPAVPARGHVFLQSAPPSLVVGFQQGMLPRAVAAIEFLMLKAAGEEDGGRLARVLWGGARPAAVAADANSFVEHLRDAGLLYFVRKEVLLELERLAILGRVDEARARLSEYRRESGAMSKGGSKGGLAVQASRELPDGTSTRGWLTEGERARLKMGESVGFAVNRRKWGREESGTAQAGDESFVGVFPSKLKFRARHRFEEDRYQSSSVPTRLEAAELYDKLVYLLRGPDGGRFNFATVVVAAEVESQGPEDLIASFAPATRERLLDRWARGLLHGLRAPEHGICTELDRVLNRGLDMMDEDDESGGADDDDDNGSDGGEEGGAGPPAERRAGAAGGDGAGPSGAAAGAPGAERELTDAERLQIGRTIATLCEQRSMITVRDLQDDLRAQGLCGLDDADGAGGAAALRALLVAADAAVSAGQPLGDFTGVMFFSDKDEICIM